MEMFNRHEETRDASNDVNEVAWAMQDRKVGHDMPRLRWQMDVQES